MTLYNVCTQIKESYCYFKTDSKAEEIESIKYKPSPLLDFEMELSSELYKAPNLLFEPWLKYNNINRNIGECIYNCVENCPLDVKQCLYENIVLSGGTSGIKVNFLLKIEFQEKLEEVHRKI